MWRQMMQASLIGAAVTIGAPDGTSPVNPTRASGEATAGERAAPAEGICRCQGKDRWRYGEPRLSDVLGDPVVQAVMRRDGVSADELSDLLEVVRAALVGPRVG